MAPSPGASTPSSAAQLHSATLEKTAAHAIRNPFIAFIVISVGALVALRRFARSDHQPTYSVGATRFVDATAVVVDAVDPMTGRGQVRLDSETWGAITATGTVIEPGTPVRVVEVRGTKLVVEPRT